MNGMSIAVSCWYSISINVYWSLTVDSRLLAGWAEEQSSQFLTPLGNRWLHVQGVANTAKVVGRTFNSVDRAYLVAAAYLHDIGYAPLLINKGFHPLDGAVFALSFGEDRLASLIAYHSGALFEANLRGLYSELRAFYRERSPIADALTYCDMVTSPIGKRISFKSRVADIRKRYGDESIVAQSLRLALPELSLKVVSTVKRLDAFGVRG